MDVVGEGPVAWIVDCFVGDEPWVLFAAEERLTLMRFWEGALEVRFLGELRSPFSYVEDWSRRSVAAVAEIEGLQPVKLLGSYGIRDQQRPAVEFFRQRASS